MNKAFNPHHMPPTTVDEAIAVLEYWGRAEAFAFDQPRAKRIAALLAFHIGLLTDALCDARLSYQYRRHGRQWVETTRDEWEDMQTCTSHDDTRYRVELKPTATLEQAERAENIRDHEIRECISALTDTAIKYSHTQQLRERLAYVVMPLLKGKVKL